MEVLIVIIAIIVAVVNANNKKTQAQRKTQQRQANARTPDAEEARAAERLRDYQAQRRQAESKNGNGAPTVTVPIPQVAPHTQGSGAAPAGTAWRCSCGETNRATAKFCTRCGKPRYGGSMNYASTEGRGRSPEGAPAPSQNRKAKVAPQGRVHPATASVTQHVVKPLTESSHRHVESSMIGVQECHEPPEFQMKERDAYAQEKERELFPYGLDFGKDAVLQGVLYAEILGKPKALRKRGA